MFNRRRHPQTPQPLLLSGFDYPGCIVFLGRPTDKMQPGFLFRKPSVAKHAIRQLGRAGRGKSMNIKVTYLQMVRRSERIVPPPREDLAVIHAKRSTVAYYRFLYDAVGRDYDWTSRKKLSDTELAALLHDPWLEVHVLMVDGVPVGFAELDRRIDGEIELVQFGLMPDFIGQGLGKYFLQWIIDKAWSYNPRRFWLHTCTTDHPAALPNYLKAGFTVYKEEVKERG
jgi:GNAT superfamily N-acetyltransferase